MNKDTGTDGAVHTSDLAAIRAVEGKPPQDCRKCVWATNLSDRPKQLSSRFYCPFGGNLCLS